VDVINLTPEFKKSLTRVHILVVLLWAGFLISTIILFFIPENLVSNFPLNEYYPNLTILKIAIWVISLVLACLLLWAKPRFYNIDSIFQASKKPLLVLNLKGETPTEKGAARLIYFYRSRMVLALTLSESVAICGLLLGTISSYGQERRLFSLISVVLLVIFYPSRAFFDGLIKEYEHREIMYELDGRWGRS
jgi:hypothetical protein